MLRGLIEERPLLLLPSLVKALGFEKATVIQQIFFMQNQPRSGRVLGDGHKWVWGTYEEWCELFFPFWEPRSLRRHITDLEKAGLLLSCKPNASDWDHTKHYRVDEAAIQALIRPDPSTTERPAEDTSFFTAEATSYTETSTETSAETSAQTTRENPQPKRDTSTASQTPPPPEKKEREQTFNLIKTKLRNRREEDPDSILTECLDEDPERDAWFDLSAHTVRQLIHEATSRYRKGEVNFKSELIVLLDRATLQARKERDQQKPKETAFDRVVREYEAKTGRKADFE